MDSAELAAPSIVGEVCLAASGSVGGDGFDPSKVSDDGGALGGGLIPNVAVLTAGMAYPRVGDPFEVDETMLAQVAACINAGATGSKSRVSHPELAGGPMWVGGDSIFHLVGQARNARVAGNQVRADMHLGPYADEGPHGAMGKRLKSIARTAPSDMGISIRFVPGESVARDGQPELMRCAAVTAVDFVGTPGGNPNGLLSGSQRPEARGQRPEARGQRPEDPTQPRGADGSARTTPSGDESMKPNAQQRAYLVSCGMAENATDEQVTQFLTGLKPVQTKYLDGLAANPPATPPAPAAQSPAPKVLSGDDGAAAADRALAADRDRRKAILALAGGDKPAVNLETARQWADDGVSLADAQRLATMAATLRPVPTGRVEGGEDRNLSTLAAGVSDALLLRAGARLMTFDRVTGLAARDSEGRIVDRKPHDRAATMRRMPVAEMARQYLSAVGVSGVQLTSLSGEQVIGLAVCRRGEFAQRLTEAGGSVSLAMSTGDFPYILADALGKVFLGGYNLAPSTWEPWCRRMTARDFKDVKLLNLSEAPALTARTEGAGITFGTMSESREIVALVEYTSGLVWTRLALLNDDLGVLRDGGASSLGAMARYKESDVAYAILTANAAMSDTGLLFNKTAVTTIGGHANKSSGSSTGIFAVAAPGLYPTVVVLFLESEPAPVLKKDVQWDTDDLKVAVRHSVAAKAADWRGMYNDVSGTCSVSELAAIKAAMAAQKAPGGAFLNLAPAFILTPTASGLDVTWAQLIGSSVDPAKNNATINPFFNRLTVIGEPRLNPS